MLPVAQSPARPSPGWPSVLQVNCGFWFGMHPPSTQTSPLEHVPPSPQGSTQCCCTQVRLPAQVAPASPWLQGIGLPVQTLFVVSHE